MSVKPIVVVAILGALFGTAAAAQPLLGAPARPDVTVAVGQALSLKAGDYGARDVADLANRLAASVGERLSRSANPSAMSQVHLVLEDATPSRPGLSTAHGASLSDRSIGLGGAWIDGYVLGADNKKQPISFSYYEADLRNTLAPTMWRDADHAFSMLAADLAQGELPQETAPVAAPTKQVAHWPN